MVFWTWEEGSLQFLQNTSVIGIWLVVCWVLLFGCCSSWHALNTHCGLFLAIGCITAMFWNCCCCCLTHNKTIGETIYSVTVVTLREVITWFRSGVAWWFEWHAIDTTVVAEWHGENAGNMRWIMCSGIWAVVLFIFLLYYLHYSVTSGHLNNGRIFISAIGVMHWFFFLLIFCLSRYIWKFSYVFIKEIGQFNKLSKLYSVLLSNMQYCKLYWTNRIWL